MVPDLVPDRVPNEGPLGLALTTPRFIAHLFQEVVSSPGVGSEVSQQGDLLVSEMGLQSSRSKDPSVRSVVSVSIFRILSL
jgi:hypothetical protein